MLCVKGVYIGVSINPLFQTPFRRPCIWHKEQILLHDSELPHYGSIEKLYKHAKMSASKSLHGNSITQIYNFVKFGNLFGYCRPTDTN